MIRGEKVDLRPLTGEDVGVMLGWNGDPEIERFIGKRFPQGHGVEDFGVQLRRNPRRLSMGVITKSGEFIGSIEIEQIDWRNRLGELRVCIGDRAYWNRGYGRDAVLTLVGHAFGKLGLSRMYLRVYASNQRAVNCYKGCGFRTEGVLRAGRRKRLGFEALLLMGLDREALRERGLTGR